MKLAVVSHKVCWLDPSDDGHALTDGGFPLQIGAISELFAETSLVVPCRQDRIAEGVSRINGRNIRISPLTEPSGEGLRRKLAMLPWLVRNGRIIWREVRRADAVHTPIPGDVGTIGLLMAMLLRKPLFVRHCGNWMVQRTLAERVWRWLMEKFAGGRNVMLATGGSDSPPSASNPAVEWIFSTSLTRTQLASAEIRSLPADGPIRLAIACRQEPRKGTDVAVRALFELVEAGNFTLDVVGSGSQLKAHEELARELGISDRITFHGKVKQSDVVMILKSAHVFCYPTTASEGFPKVVLEALASGLPVVTTKVSVLPTLINKGCGIVVDDATPKEVAQAILKICESDGIYRTYSKRSVEVAGEYSLEKWREFIDERLRRAWQVAALDA